MADFIDLVSDLTMSLMVDFRVNFSIRISPSDCSKSVLVPHATEAMLSSDKMKLTHLVIVESFF